MKLLSIPCGGPVGAFRSVLPFASLRERGHAVGWAHESCGLPRDVQEGLIRSADLVSYVGPGRTRLFEDRPACFREMRGVLVVEFDDNPWAWVRDAASRDPAHHRMLEEANDEAWKPLDDQMLACFESWIQGADLVTTTTEALANVFREHGAREVAVCPNALAPAFVRHKPRRGELTPGGVLDRLKREKLGLLGTKPTPINKRIGWTGTVAHIADLPPVLHALRGVLSTDASVALLSLGPVKFTERFEWDGFRPSTYKQVVSQLPNGKHTDTVPFEHYYPALEAMDCDLAVIPMRASDFNATKSDVTLLSWGIQGVPVVCSRFGPYALAELAGFPAVYVDHEDVSQWKSAIRDLLYDRAKARELGDRAREWVLAKRCFPAAVDPWEQSFLNACAKKGVEVTPARPFAEVVEEVTTGRNGS